MLTQNNLVWNGLVTGHFRWHLYLGSTRKMWSSLEFYLTIIVGHTVTLIEFLSLDAVIFTRPLHILWPLACIFRVQSYELRPGGQTVSIRVSPTMDDLLFDRDEGCKASWCNPRIGLGQRWHIRRIYKDLNKLKEALMSKIVNFHDLPVTLACYR